MESGKQESVLEEQGFGLVLANPAQVEALQGRKSDKRDARRIAVPDENVRAGQQKSTRCRKDNRALRRVLRQAAWAVSHCKDGYLRAFFHRAQVRRGWAKAIVATAHKTLIIAYCVLRDGSPYRELGGDYFDKPEALAFRCRSLALICLRSLSVHSDGSGELFGRAFSNLLTPECVVESFFGY